MERMCYLIVLVALMAAFMILLMKKWGVTEWMQVHGNRFVSQMFACDFCLSFWTGTVLFFVAACIYGEPLYVLCGMMSCPLTRLML